MKEAWREISNLVRLNATHRKGWKLGDAAVALSVKNARDELSELVDSPDDVEELADVMGCLIVYAVKKGWSVRDVEKALLKKLRERFTVHAKPLKI